MKRNTVARDKDAAIYRSFENLSSRNLLYLQSELHDLERQSDELDSEDAKSIDGGDAQRAAKCWLSYNNDMNEQACKRRELQDRIKIKIKEYRMYWSSEGQIVSFVKFGS